MCEGKCHRFVSRNGYNILHFHTQNDDTQLPKMLGHRLQNDTRNDMLQKTICTCTKNKNAKRQKIVMESRITMKICMTTKFMNLYRHGQSQKWAVTIFGCCCLAPYTYPYLNTTTYPNPNPNPHPYPHPYPNPNPNPNPNP
jgi:hypothetical protein